MGVILRDAHVSSDASISSWIRTPYGVRLSEDPANSFKNLMQMEKFIMAQDGENSGIIAEWMQVLESNKLGNGDVNKDGLADGDVFYSKQNFTDTRVGGNDAINPYWQFNRDDDIVPPSLVIQRHPHSGTDVSSGMGRVYNEVYDANQQILWLSMGVPEYVNLVSFYRDAGDINAARAMNRGTLRGIAGKLIKLVFSATIWAITFPVTAPFWINRWISRIQTERISKYYYFKPSMVLYYEMVNTMLSYLAVGMGLYPQWIVRRRDSTKVLNAQYAQMQGEADPNQTMMSVTSVNSAISGSTTELQQPAEQTQQKPKQQENTDVSDTIIANNVASSTNGQGSTYTGTLDTQLQDNGVGGVTDQQVLKDEFLDRLQNKPIQDSGIPELLRNGPDIFAIINRRAMIFNQTRYRYTTRMLMDQMMSNQNQTTGSNYFTSPDTKYQTDKNGNVVAAADPPDAEKTGAWANTWSSLKSNMFGAGDYVGFRVERGVNCTESISNQTGPTGVAQKMNSYAQQQREKYENYGNSWVAKTLGELAKGPSDALKSAMTDLTAMLGEKLGLGDIGAVLTQGNGFLDMPDVWKGSSFSRSYSFNIQLRARYGDPVSIFQSVYIPLIMLLAAAMPRSVGDSMYTSPFLIKAYCKGMFAVPCGIIESMSISRGKDEFGWSHDHLPTSIDVNLQIKDLTPTFFLSMQDIGLFDTFSRNDNMMEYLDTLSALGITERLYMWPKVMRKMTAAFLTKRNTIFNSNYWGMRLGRNNVARLIAAVTPFANHEKSDWQYGNVTGSIFNGNDARTAGNRYVQN